MATRLGLGKGAEGRRDDDPNQPRTGRNEHWALKRRLYDELGEDGSWVGGMDDGGVDGESGSWGMDAVPGNGFPARVYLAHAGRVRFSSDYDEEG